MLKRLAIIAVLQITLGSALSVVAFAQLAPSASEIDRNVNASYRNFTRTMKRQNSSGRRPKQSSSFPT